MCRMTQLRHRLAREAASSVLNRKFAALKLSFDGSVVYAEALDGGEDIVCRFGPSKRLWVGVVVADEGSDIGAQGGDASVDAAPDLFVSQQSKEALDLVEPR